MDKAKEDESLVEASSSVEVKDFCGYSQLYAEAVETDGQLLMQKALDISPDLYHELKSCHEKYKQLLQQAALSEQQLNKTINTL